MLVADADGANVPFPKITGGIVDGSVFRNGIDFTPRRYKVRYSHRTLLNCRTGVILGRLCLGTQLILSASPLDRFSLDILSTSGTDGQSTGQCQISR